MIALNNMGGVAWAVSLLWEEELSKSAGRMRAIGRLPIE